MRVDGPDAVNSDDGGSHAAVTSALPTSETHSNDRDNNGAAPPIAGLIRRAALDDKPRKSAAYLHTEPYELVVDRKSGIEYEVRACKYCDTAFSFKGGTTSSALRHLRFAHSQQVFGVPRVPKPRPSSLKPPVSLLLQLIQQPSEPPQAQEAPEASEPSLLVSESQPPPQEDFGTEADAIGENHDEPPAPEQADEPEFQNTSHDALDDELSDERPPLATPPPPRHVYYKRRRYDDLDSASGHHHHGALPLTVNQVAVAHFIAHYKHVLPPPKRFAFIKHLTYNDREAAMYNVLDDELRLEFLAQFRDHGVNAALSAASGI